MADTRVEMELAELLRDAVFAMSHAEAAMVAFVPSAHINAVTRDCQRLADVRKRIAAMLEMLPPEPPLTAEEEAATARVIGAVLEKRFGSGEDRVGEALEAWRGRREG